jgi:hypothetical protein
MILVSNNVSVANPTLLINDTVAGQEYSVVLKLDQPATASVQEGPREYTSFNPGQQEQHFVIVASQEHASIVISLGIAQSVSVTVSSCVSPLVVSAGQDPVRAVWAMPTVTSDWHSSLKAKLELQRLETNVTWATVGLSEVAASSGSYTYVPATSLDDGLYRCRLQLCAGSLCSKTPAFSATLKVMQENIVFDNVLAVLDNATLTLSMAKPQTPYSKMYRWSLAEAADGSKMLLDWQVDTFGLESDTLLVARELSDVEQDRIAGARHVFAIVEVFLLEG